MKKVLGFALAVSITALMMLAGCGSAEKNSSPAPTPGGAHSMPGGTKMNEQDMKR